MRRITRTLLTLNLALCAAIMLAGCAQANVAAPAPAPGGVLAMPTAQIAQPAQREPIALPTSAPTAQPTGAATLAGSRAKSEALSAQRISRMRFAAILGSVSMWAVAKGEQFRHSFSTRWQVARPEEPELCAGSFPTSPPRNEDGAHIKSNRCSPSSGPVRSWNPTLPAARPRATGGVFMAI